MDGDKITRDQEISSLHGQGHFQKTRPAANIFENLKKKKIWLKDKDPTKYILVQNRAKT